MAIFYFNISYIIFEFLRDNAPRGSGTARKWAYLNIIFIILALLIQNCYKYIHYKIFHVYTNIRML